MMDPTIIACERHLPLVQSACADDATDTDLERYAEEVPECTDCRRALARDLQVHPVVLEPDPSSELPSIEGMDRLMQALHSSQQTPWRAAARWSLAAVVLMAALWSASALWPPAQVGEPTAAVPIPMEYAPRDVVQGPAVTAPVERVDVEVAPQEPAPRKPSPEPVQVASVTPAPRVAVADWPPPPFEELRSGTAKGEGRLQGFQLVLSGGSGARAVGDTVQLTVVASAPSPLAVCVGGPENGVVWRGGLPAGRVDLEREGHLQSFTFSTSGTYQFSVSTSDLDGCADPVHVLKVDVVP